MAEPKIGSLQERKARLLMESDTLRYNLQLQGNEVEAHSRVFMQGVQVARLGASLFGVVSSLRGGRRGRKSFSISRLLVRFLFRSH